MRSRPGLLAAPYRPGAPTAPGEPQSSAAGLSGRAWAGRQAGDLGDGHVAGLRSIAFGLKHKLDTLAYSKILTGEGTPPMPAR